MATFQSSATVFLLFFAVWLLFGAAPALSHLCPRFDCGQIQGLTYPFRLKEHPPGCGEEEYQLSCTEHKAMINIKGNVFYVTAVWYQNDTLWLVDPSLENSTCKLPSPHLSPSILRNTTLRTIPTVESEYMVMPITWVSFMNCTKPIQGHHLLYPFGSEHHLLIPCLSSKSSFIYAVACDPSVGFLGPTCRYLAMAPVYSYEMAYLNLTISNLFEILGKGSHFYFHTRHHSWQYMAIHTCVREAKSLFLNQTRGKRFYHFIPSLVKSEHHVVHCINIYPDRTSSFWWAIVVFVLIMILQFLILALVFGRFLASQLILCYYMGSKFLKSRDSVDTVEKFLRSQQRLFPTRYTYADIVVITKNFKEKLGQGGFGSVFKGELLGGFLVAVKVLNHSKHNGEEFISEISTIGRIHHVNVVRLVGFCAEGSKRALIYEYMPNGSLDKFIFSSDTSTDVYHLHSSERLISIALGVARGIDYLHRGCEMQILHFDIKPHNILLDCNLTPRVSDFGLAKLYPKDNSLVTVSVARGTVGYIAPELISRSFGVISYKSDVYSFGMLLLEMAGGRRNADPLVEKSSRIYYPSWIYDQLDLHKENGHGDLMPINEVERKLSIIGLWCIQLKPLDRPTMSKVIEMLEDDADALTMPPKPFFSSMESISEHQSYTSLSSFDSSAITQDEQLFSRGEIS